LGCCKTQGQWQDNFFEGDEHNRYDIASDKSDSGYPRKISEHWPGLWPDGVDAAVNWGEWKSVLSLCTSLKASNMSGGTYRLTALMPDSLDPYTGIGEF
jgi:hypothetical protein